LQKNRRQWVEFEVTSPSQLMLLLQIPQRRLFSAIPHATTGQVVDIRPLREKLQQSVTSTVVKTDKPEVIRLVLPAGKEIPHHQVTGERIKGS
jgi:hypothetical protein